MQHHVATYLYKLTHEELYKRSGQTTNVSTTMSSVEVDGPISPKESQLNDKRGTTKSTCSWATKSSYQTYEVTTLQIILTT